MSVKCGVLVPQGWRQDLTEIADPVAQFEAMVNVAKVADSLPAFDAIWIYDHFHTIPTPTKNTTFEAWTSTAALARETQRINVGQLVTCNSYRHPALLAKMASTVDVMSHGRLYFGLGAGWYEHEYRAYGYPFLETRDRMRAFREACAIVHAMWTEDAPTFSGEHYTINKPINEPKGVRKPHPLFWIGGQGEQVTLKLVAQFGDASNFTAPPEVTRHKLDVLRRHCDTVGRDYDSLIKSVNMIVFPLAPGEDGEQATRTTQRVLRVSYEQLREQGMSNPIFIGTSAALVERIRDYIALGVTYINFYIPQVAYEPERLHRIAEEIIPHLG